MAELYYSEEGIELWCGDCRPWLGTLPADSVDACVTDPPAGIGFMGKEWDEFKTAKPGENSNGFFNHSGTARLGGRVAGYDRHRFIAFLTPIMAELLRVLKPGAHALVWALPRTSHWTGTALEDAGFEVRDRISHLFGQGFPKSGNLKPAIEDWWLVRKPFSEGTREANVARWGVGGLEIERCRVEGGERRLIDGSEQTGAANNGWGTMSGGSRAAGTTTAGRYPPHFVLSHLPECVPVGVRRVKSSVDGVITPSGNSSYETRGASRANGYQKRGYADANGCEQVSEWRCAEGCPVAELDAQAGVRSGASSNSSTKNGHAGTGWGMGDLPVQPGYGDTGPASRFFPVFYSPKASRSERGDGNRHPTVKSVPLMRWLARLITPKGGDVIDPFFGSGSTALACRAEGFRFIGSEREEEYCEIAKARLKGGELFDVPFTLPEPTPIRQEALAL